MEFDSETIAVTDLIGPVYAVARAASIMCINMAAELGCHKLVVPQAFLMLHRWDDPMSSSLPRRCGIGQ